MRSSATGTFVTGQSLECEHYECEELIVLEMVELVNSWKKFGRPQTLVDRNTKNSLKTREIDPADEVIGLLSGWLRQYPSQQLILMFILSGAILTSTGSISFTDSPDLFWMFLSGMPRLMVISVAVWPLFIAFLLFPFKWGVFNLDQRKVAERNMTWTNVILLLVIILAPNVSLVSISGMLTTLVVFGFYITAGYCMENIRLAVRGSGQRG